MFLPGLDSTDIKSLSLLKLVTYALFTQDVINQYQRQFAAKGFEMNLIRKEKQIKVLGLGIFWGEKH